MIGFYDLTGFGKVPLQPVDRAEDSDKFVFSIGGKKLSFAKAIGAKDILFSGVLSEAQLAKDYYADTGIDLDQNQNLSDEFMFVVGHNSSGQPTVWLDRNKNDAIDSGNAADSEELTDYNSTFDFINMDRSTPSGAKPVAVTIADVDGKNVSTISFYSRWPFNVLFSDYCR